MNALIINAIPLQILNFLIEFVFINNVYMKKLILKIGFVIVLVLTAAFFFIQYQFEKKITSSIKALPENIQVKYATIETNVLAGKVSLDSVSVKVFNHDNKLTTSFLDKKFTINGLSLWQFIFNNKIAIENIAISNPKLTYFQQQNDKNKKKDSSKVTDFDKKITIDNLTINMGFLQVHNQKDSTILKIDSINFTLDKWSTDAKKLKEKLPFSYQDLQFDTKEIFLKMSDFENLKIKQTTYNNRDFKLQNLYLEPKYSKEVLSTKLAVERDHIQLHIPELKLEELDFSIQNKTFSVSSDTCEITKPNLVIYRDKRVADDETRKKMYSEMLRNLSFQLAISQLKIEQGYISYAERLKDTEKSGMIFFDEVNASIKNLSNTYKNDEKTEISANSNFMAKVPMNLDISFDVTNKEDAFLASGQFENFNAQIVNDFFESNLKAKAEGEIQQIYFTFYGNKSDSKGDLKMKYKEFKFEILNQKNRVNKFLSAIGNLFVNDGSKTDEDGFRHGKIEVKRNQNKSFFNYLWINVESGLISTLTGDGEKE